MYSCKNDDNKDDETTTTRNMISEWNNIMNIRNDIWAHLCHIICETPILLVWSDLSGNGNTIQKPT